MAEEARQHHPEEEVEAEAAAYQHHREGEEAVAGEACQHHLAGEVVVHWKSVGAAPGQLWEVEAERLVLLAPASTSEGAMGAHSKLGLWAVTTEARAGPACPWVAAAALGLWTEVREGQWCAVRQMGEARRTVRRKRLRHPAASWMAAVEGEAQAQGRLAPVVQAPGLRTFQHRATAAGR